MNTVIIVISAVATIVLGLSLLIFIFIVYGEITSIKDLFEKETYDISDIYELLSDKCRGYLRKNDCSELIDQYYELDGKFKEQESYNIKAKKLLQLGDSFTVEDAKKQRDELGKQYIPSPYYTDEKNLELLGKLWELRLAYKRLRNIKS